MTMILTFVLLAIAPGQSPSIRQNQVGYAPHLPKLAVLVAATDSVRLVGPLGETVWKGAPAPALEWAEAGETGSLVDFSEVTQPGTYRLVAGTETSWPITIQPRPWEALVKGLVKGLWYNRASYAIPATYGGAWAREAGHSDTAVRIHPSAAGPVRKASFLLRSPGGWYDAGDYGKYLPSAAIATWSLLHLYQTFPSYLDTLSVGVGPHPGVASDLLDEALWSLRWMLTMQDPADGGVYHRLTTAGFPGDAVVPSADRSTRYVGAKSTAATLELAAVAAKAHRILETQVPALADSCLAAAQAAWLWARRNSTAYFLPDSLNDVFSPTIEAGPYSDRNVSDEFDWAASELLLATRVDTFATAIRLADRVKVDRLAPLIDWGDVRSLGILSLSLEKGQIPSSSASLGEGANSMIVMAARAIRKVRDQNGFHLPDAPFKWSSTTVFANNGVLCWNAWRITRDTSYQSAALDMLDYLLGRNATGYSFVTGFGSRTPLHPHHRISTGDAVEAPVPGMLVGGPNPGQEDACPGYPSTLAAKSYVDAVCSYASNEPSVNQNAALILLAGALSADLADTTSTSIRKAAQGRSLSVSLRGGELHVRIPSAAPLAVEILGPDGRIVAKASGIHGEATLPAPRRGIWLIRARSEGLFWSSPLAVP